MEKFEYAPAPESAALVDIKSEYGLFINGKFVAPKGGKTFTTVNPATEEVLAKVAYAELADVNLAVTAARNAFTKTWSKMPAAERGKYLFRIARILQEPGLPIKGVHMRGTPMHEEKNNPLGLGAKQWSPRCQGVGLNFGATRAQTGGHQSHQGEIAEAQSRPTQELAS